MKIINKKSEKSLIDEFISNFKKDYFKNKKQKKRFSLVLTGGESPKKLYRKLAKINIDWNYVDLFWGDERYVPSSSKNSNFNLAFNEARSGEPGANEEMGSFEAGGTLYIALLITTNPLFSLFFIKTRIVNLKNISVRY